MRWCRVLREFEYSVLVYCVVAALAPYALRSSLCGSIELVRTCCCESGVSDGGLACSLMLRMEAEAAAAEAQQKGESGPVKEGRDVEDGTIATPVAVRPSSSGRVSTTPCS